MLSRTARIGVQLACAVVEAHENNLQRIRVLDPESMRRAYTDDQLLSMAREGGVGPGDPAECLQCSPHYSTSSPGTGRVAYRSDMRIQNLPLSNHESLQPTPDQ